MEGVGKFCAAAGHWDDMEIVALKGNLQAYAAPGSSSVPLHGAMAQFSEGDQLNSSPIKL